MSWDDPTNDKPDIADITTYHMPWVVNEIEQLRQDAEEAEGMPSFLS